MISVRPLRYRSPSFALLLGCLLAVGSACGISIDGDDDTTEIFKRVTVTQPLVAGQPITVTVEYEQPYAVQVEIACDLLRDEPGPASQRRVVRGLQDRIPENPEGSTAEEATPTTGEVTREFVAPPVPGNYIMRCFTTADPNNRVEVRVTVLPAEERSPASGMHGARALTSEPSLVDVIMSVGQSSWHLLGTPRDSSTSSVTAPMC